jgi:hypothetical protein
MGAGASRRIPGLPSTPGCPQHNAPERNTQSDAPVVEKAETAGCDQAALALPGDSAAVGGAPSPLAGCAAVGAAGTWDDWDDDAAQNAQGAPKDPAIAARASRTAVAALGPGSRCTISGDNIHASLDTALVCFHCSHEVYRFADARWAAVDYFWFRNYAPDARLPGQEVRSCLALGPLTACLPAAPLGCAPPLDGLSPSITHHA